MSFKKRLKQVLVLLIVLGLITKVYFEIDNYTYELTLEEMKKNDQLSVNINSSVEHKTLDLKDYLVHYYVSGAENETSIVFLHPAFSDHRAFEQQIDYFTEHYKVITIDLIGHGLSKANQSKDKIDVAHLHLSKILEKENIKHTHIVGVSIGALIGQYFALNYPKKVASLTALGGYDINTINHEVTKAQRKSNMGLVFRAIFSMKAFRKQTALITCQSKKGQALFYHTTSHYTRRSFLAMQGLQTVIQNRKNIDIPYPVLILTGAFDIDLAKKMAKDWHTKIPHSEFNMIENAGHCANIDAPLIFNKLVKTFIDKNSKSIAKQL